MAVANSAIVELLSHEGGYQANPADPGNYDPYGNLIGTNWGITPGVYYDYFGSYPNAAGMRLLPYNSAYAIYQYMYWDRYNLGSIPDQAVANHILDTLVLHGRGARLIQETINDLGYPLPLDNVYGSNTQQAVFVLTSTSDTAKIFNNALADTRIDYVTGLTEQDPTLLQFLPGWKKRILDFASGSKALKITAVFLFLGIAGGLYYLRQTGRI